MNSVLVSLVIGRSPGRKHPAYCTDGGREGGPTVVKLDSGLTLTHRAELEDLSSHADPERGSEFHRTL